MTEIAQRDLIVGRRYTLTWPTLSVTGTYAGVSDRAADIFRACVFGSGKVAERPLRVPPQTMRRASITEEVSA